MKQIILIFVAILTSCASLNSSSQIVMITSQPNGVQLSANREVIGVTPNIFRLDRSYSLNLQIGKQQVATKIIKSSYRWRESFFHNLVFLWGAPVGWLVDLITGSAFEYPDKIRIVSSEPPDIVVSSKKPTKIAIAPPKTAHPDISDELGIKLVDLLQRSNPNAIVLDYKDTLETFKLYGFDYDGDNKKKYNDLYYYTGADFIYFSDVITDNESAIVRGKLRNHLNLKESKKSSMTIDRDNLEVLNNIGWFGRRSFLHSLIPNTIAIDSKSQSMRLDVDQIEHRSIQPKNQSSLDRILSYVETLSLRSLRPPSQRKDYVWNFEWNTTFSLGASEEVFDTLFVGQNWIFKRFHLFAGVGGVLDFGNDLWRVAFFWHLLWVIIESSLQTKTL